MKTIWSDGKYLTDLASYGLADAWSEKLADAMPISEVDATKVMATFRRLCPRKQVRIDDASPECVGRPVGSARLAELRKTFVSSHR